MSGSNDTQSGRDLSEIKGALDVLFTLRGVFAQWLEEAQDEARKEELENPQSGLGHEQASHFPRFRPVSVN